MSCALENLGVPERDVIRWKEKLTAELNIEDADDAAPLDAMARHLARAKLRRAGAAEIL